MHKRALSAAIRTKRHQPRCGLGDDTYHFYDPSDSLLGLGIRDVVSGFETNGDDDTLSFMVVDANVHIGCNQAFAAFSTTGPQAHSIWAVLAYDHQFNDVYSVFADVGGDAVADMEVLVGVNNGFTFDNDDIVL